MKVILNAFYYNKFDCTKGIKNIEIKYMHQLIINKTLIYFFI